MSHHAPTPEVEALAEARLSVAEQSLTRKPKLSLRGAFAEFIKHPSPWMITLTLAGALTWRIQVGQWGWGDLIMPVVMVAMFPLSEWLIHVFVLHYRPRKVAGIMLDYELARKHREHHTNPRDLPLVFIPTRTLAGLIVGSTAFIAWGLPALGGNQGLGLTYLITATATGIIYEWMHYLIHSDYAPRGATYKSIWRSHRLHHYRNEHYWFTVTTTRTADVLLGTFPDPDTIEPSRTAKNLHGSVSAPL